MNAANRLDQIEARANATTEGPWTVTYEFTEGECGSGGEPYPYAIQGPADHSTLDADWLSDEYRAKYAHARQDVPALVAALRAVLDLHAATANCRIHPVTFERSAAPDICAECSVDGDTLHPCPTVQAIDKHLGGES